MPQRAHTTYEYRLDDSIGFLMHKVHQLSARALRRQLEPLGLTEPQFGLLAMLVEKDGQRQASLCERGSIDPNTMVGLLDRLEAAKLVRRCRDPRDRRAYLVRITPTGREMFQRCVPRQRLAAERCWCRLTAHEQRTLRTLLRRVLETHPSTQEVVDVRNAPA